MIEVVGVPASGVPSLPADVRQVVDRAAVLVGSPRLLDTAGDHPARRIPWPRPLLAGLDALLAELADGPGPVVVLATGDPLDHGVATTLIGRLGADRVRVHPVAGSVALARAAMGWSAHQTDVISLLTAPVTRVNPLLTPHRRFLVLSADATTPIALADHLRASGWGRSTVTVLGDLGTERASRHTWLADAEPPTDLPRLNIVAVETPAGPTLGTSPGRPDDCFEHDGQLSKRELRASALACLRPAPGQLLWDLGAGAGSVGIEWALHDPRCRTIAVERDPDRAERIGDNARRAGVGTVEVVTGEAIDHIDALPDPDAVFLGGGITADLIDRVWRRLRPGGRLVAHTVTIDTEQTIWAAHRTYGGDLRRIMIERAEPLGRYLAWRPARPVVEWSATRTHESETS